MIRRKPNLISNDLDGIKDDLSENTAKKYINVFNYLDEDVAKNKILNNGVVTSGYTGWIVTGYIECKPNDCFRPRNQETNWTVYAAFYDSNKVCKSYVNNVSDSPYITIPDDEDIRYVRMSYNAYGNGGAGIGYPNLAIYKTSDYVTEYGRYNEPFISQSLLQNEQNCVKSVYNVIDLSDVDVLTNKVINGSNGTETTASGWKETGYITCKPGDVFTWQNYPPQGKAQNIAFYNAQKEFIYGHNSFEADPSIVIPDADIYYFRIALDSIYATYALYNTSKEVGSYLPPFKKITESIGTFDDGLYCASESSLKSGISLNQSGKTVKINALEGTNYIVRANVVELPSSNKIPVKHFGKNLSHSGTSYTFATSANTTKYACVDVPFNSDDVITISANISTSISAANFCFRILGGIFPSGKLLPSLNNIQGHVEFVFVFPSDGVYSIGIYCVSPSAEVTVSDIQVEFGYVATSFTPVQYKSYEITSTGEQNIATLTPIKGQMEYWTVSFSYNATITVIGTDDIVYKLPKETDDFPYEYACGKIVCIGDSLTRGLYAQTSVGDIVQNYPYYLGRYIDAEITNISKSGGTPEYIYTNVNGIISADFTDKDTAIIWLGTNGGLYESEMETAGSQSNYYKLIIDYILQHKPDIQIFLCTVFTTGEISSGLAYATPQETNRVIRNYGETYNLPVIDMSDLSVNQYSRLHNMQTNTHFGKYGNMYIANRVKNFMHDYFAADKSKIEFGLISALS